MSEMNSERRVELLLDLLLEAAAPLPHGISNAPQRSFSTQLANGSSTQLLVSFQQLAEKLSTLVSPVCFAHKSAIISYNGETFYLHSQFGLSTEEISILGSTYSSPFLKDSDSVDPARTLANAWSKLTRENPTKVLVIDQYGETTVFLLLAWDTGKNSAEELSTLEENSELMGRVANGAVRLQRKTASSRRRARWMTSSRTLTEALLSGADEEEALTLVAEAAKSGAGADASLIFLPSVGGKWACEIACGDDVEGLIGMPFPNDSVFSGVLEGGHGIILRNAGKYLDPAQADISYGPIVLAPLNDAHRPNGALALLRKSDREPFGPDDLPSTEAFASQTSLTLEVASARHSQSLAILLEDRDRISRDLHDFAVQQLFATGMKLDSLRQGVQTGTLSSRRITAGLDEAMASLEDSVRQIRSIVHNLKEHDLQASFTERLEQEASRARHFLGFAPSLLFELDGLTVNPGSSTATQQIHEMSNRVSDAITDDAVALVREALSNIARHARARATRVEAAVSGQGSVGELVISVVDDGKGVDPNQTRSSGLANMSKRARLHGGSFAVGAGPRGRGTSLVWRVPLAQENLQRTDS